jgi:hypothetical protein
MSTSLGPILLLMLALQGASAQQPEPLRLTPSGPLLPDEQQLRATIGKDVDALVPDVLAHWLSMPSAKAVNVIAEQFPAAWLPSNVRFTRIPLEVAKGRWVEDCLRLLWITAQTHEDSLVVTITQGNRCFTMRSDDVFDRTRDGWQRRGGLRGGSAGGVSDCGCKVE